MISKTVKQLLSMLVCSTLLIAGTPADASSIFQDQAPTPGSSQASSSSQPSSSTATPTVAPQTPDQLDALVAPIALYPDPENEAKNGIWSYIAGGTMTGRFAIIASPVTYGDSGIITFILNRQGVVYQKDLGTKTADLAASINNYSPDDRWTSAE